MNTYRARYSVYQKTGPRVMTLHAGSPITAINQFHRNCQKDLELTPDEYQLNRLSLVYYQKPNDPTTEIESDFDLPSGPNPDLGVKQEPPAEDTTTMDFLGSGKGL